MPFADDRQTVAQCKVASRPVREPLAIAVPSVLNAATVYAGICSVDLEVSEAKRLRALKDENVRLKRLLADALLDNAGLKKGMNILERFPVAANGWGSVANLHLLAETLKLVSADRRLVGGAPDWNSPANGLASKAYAGERARLIRPDRSLSAKDVPDGNPYPYESKDTTHFSVADAAGNAVSNTYTLSASYGAHVVAPGTGILLNNSLGNLAWGRNDKATQPVPNKRVGSTITPIIAFRDDKPWLVTGTPGGGYIIGTMVQLLANVIDHRLNIAEAAERPRINQGGGDAPLELEEGFSPDIVPLLRAKGHKVRPSNTMGSIQSIMIYGDRFMGAADTRRPDAAAVGVR